MSPKFYELSKHSLRKQLENEKFNKRVIDEIVSIACLTNYGQSNEINAFCGLISLAGGFSGKLWSVVETNQALAIKILQQSEANVLLDTKVGSKF